MYSSNLFDVISKAEEPFCAWSLKFADRRRGKIPDRQYKF
jgi:hypothetical protein